MRHSDFVRGWGIDFYQKEEGSCVTVHPQEFPGGPSFQWPFHCLPSISAFPHSELVCYCAIANSWKHLNSEFLEGTFASTFCSTWAGLGGKGL